MDSWDEFLYYGRSNTVEEHTNTPEPCIKKAMHQIQTMKIEQRTMIAAVEDCLREWKLDKELNITYIDITQFIDCNPNGTEFPCIRVAQEIQVGKEIKKEAVIKMKMQEIDADCLRFHHTWVEIDNPFYIHKANGEFDGAERHVGRKEAAIEFIKNGRIKATFEIICEDNRTLIAQKIKEKIKLTQTKTEKVIRPLPNFIELDKILTELENASKTLTKEDHEKIIPIIRRLRIIIS